ncbi:MAG: PKD domain-containing protein [Flavobacteriales bacterium]|nr:PKD domain-containing protein [Flavobacteriales bacterium]
MSNLVARQVVLTLLIASFSLVSLAQSQQVSRLRVLPANSVGMYVDFKCPSGSQNVTYELSYMNVTTQSSYTLATIFSGSSAGYLFTYTIPAAQFNQSDMYRFKVEEQGSGTSTTVMQSFIVVWCSSQNDILHTFNQPYGSGAVRNLHEGLDVLGGGAQVRAAKGGFINAVNHPDVDNVQIVIQIFESNAAFPLSIGSTMELYEYNHVGDGSFAEALFLLASQQMLEPPSVHPGQILGSIGENHFAPPYEDHVHMGYYVGGTSGNPANFRNPLKLFQEPGHRDPYQNAPQLYDLDGDQLTFRFAENLLAPNYGPLTYFPEPQTQGMPVKVWGGVDIAVELHDLQAASGPPYVMPYEVGYSFGSLPDFKLFKSDNWLAIGCNPPCSTCDCSTFVDALTDRSNHDQSGWEEYRVLIPTNTSANTGNGADISQDECWATDAHSSVNTPNGYTSGYSKARCYEEAKFEDGTYTAKVSFSDLEHPNGEVSRNVMVDNFKPYVKHVRISTGQSPSEFSGAEMIYEGRREWNESTGELELHPFNGCCGSSSRVLGYANPYHDDVYIEVTFSEPMDGSNPPVVSIPSITSGYTAQLQSTSSYDETVFEYLVSSSDLQTNLTEDVHELVISGTDKAGNGLTGFDESAENISATQLPKRTGASTWSSTYGLPSDVTHEFHTMTPCTPAGFLFGGGGNTAPVNPCVFTDFDASPLVGDAPLQVSFTNLSTSAAPVASWLWNFGDGSSSSDENPQPHTYTSPGVYTVRLTVTDQAGVSDFEEKVAYIYVTEPSGGGSPSPLQADFYGSPYDSQTNRVELTQGDLATFYEDVSGGTGSLVYEWDFPGGTPSSHIGPYPPEIEYDQIGLWNVTLTVTDGSGASDMMLKQGYVNVGLGADPLVQPNPCFEIVNTSSVNQGYAVYDFLSFQADYPSGGVPPYSYTWTLTGNGVNQVQYGTSLSHYFTQPGQYTVTLSVDDSNPVTSGYSCSQTFNVVSNGGVSTINLTRTPASVSTGSEWIYLNATYSGSNVSSANYYWQFTCPTAQDFTVHEYVFPTDYDGYNGVYQASFSILGDVSYSVVSLQPDRLGPGNWTVQLRIETVGGDPVLSNPVNISIASPPTSSSGPEITGITFHSNPNAVAQPNGQMGQCYFVPHPNLGVGPVVIPGDSPFLAGDNAVCDAQDYPNCPCNQEYHFLNDEITAYGGSPGGQILLRDGSWGSAWETAFGNDWFYGSGGICPEYGSGHQDGWIRIDNSFTWDTPWHQDISITVTDRYGHQASISQPITVFRCLTQADAGNDIVACPESIYTIGGDVQSGTKPPYTFSWDFQSGGGLPGVDITEVVSDPALLNPILTVPDGTVTLELTVSDAFGNSATDAITITGSYVQADAGPDVNLCLGNSLVLGGAVTGGSGVGYTYSWSPTTGLNDPHVQNPLFTPLGNGVYTYTVTVTDGNGCSDTDQITITVDDDKPIVDAGDDVVSCPGGYVTLGLDVTGGGTGNYTFEWSPTSPVDVTQANGALSTEAPLGNTNYRVIVTDDNGCTGEDWISVFIDNDLSEGVTASSGVPVGVCPMGSFELTAVPTVAGNYTYSWSWGDPGLGNEGNDQGSPITTGTFGNQTYTLEATNLTTGCISWDEVSVVVDPSMGPTATVDPSQLVMCYGAGPMDVQGGASGGTAPYNYAWYLGNSDLQDAMYSSSPTAVALSNSSTASVPYNGVSAYMNDNGLAQADVWLLVTDQNGCVGTNSLSAVADPELAIHGLYAQKYSCSGDPVTIGDGTEVTGGTPDYQYEWLHPTVPIDNPNQLITVAYPDHTAYMKFRVTDALGCAVEADAGLGYEYVRLHVFEEQGDPQLELESQLGLFCPGQEICIKNSMYGYWRNFDLGRCSESGLYPGSFTFVSSVFNYANGPCDVYNAVGSRFSDDFVSYTDLPEQVTVEGDGCLTFSAPGTYDFTANYEFRYGYSWTANPPSWYGQPGCTLTYSNPIHVEIQPMATFPPEDPTEYVNGPINQPSPQNDRYAVDLEVAIDQYWNSISTVVSAGIQADHVAADWVRIHPGFKAEYGSDYTARINPCMEFASGKFAGEDEEGDTLNTDSLTYATARDSLLMQQGMFNKGDVFSVYPNPNSGEFTVVCTDLKKLTVMDASGRLVWQSDVPLNEASDQSNMELKLSGFSNGVYIVRAMRTNDVNLFSRVVVQ